MNGVQKQQRLEELYEYGNDVQNSLHWLENNDEIDAETYRRKHRQLEAELADIDEEMGVLLTDDEDFSDVHLPPEFEDDEV